MVLQSPQASASQTACTKLTEHRALIFDVYGTLVDWESAIHDALLPVFPNLSRQEILVNYAEVEGKLQMQFQSVPYSKILELAYLQLTTPSGMASVGVSGELKQAQHGPTSNLTANKLQVSTHPPHPPVDGALRFGRSIAKWTPFSDTIDALHRLKKHFALVVLSNVDDDSFAGTHAQLCTPDYPGSAFLTVTPNSPFSLVLTAQQVGAYKPNPLMLQSALRQLSAYPDPSLPSNPSVGVDAAQVLVVANSIRHDIIPAKQHGLRSVWISRHGVNIIGNEGDVATGSSDQQAAAVGRYPYTWRYETLGELAEAVEVEEEK